jgi:hypothetical protein
MGVEWQKMESHVLRQALGMQVGHGGTGCDAWAAGSVGGLQAWQNFSACCPLRIVAS